MTDVTGRGNPHPLYAAEKHTAVVKRNGLPRRRCTPLKGAALCGKDLGLAYLALRTPLGASLRGAVGGEPTEGSPVYRLEQMRKDLTHYKHNRRGRPLCRPHI